ncbi:RNA polymerase subunit sigma [Olsenella uli]|uniref:sigma factor n=1 Tax=Olsenella uli TaxID=133926 RepID=UPI00195E4D06|nr:sigma factor [Olsenella uli]MBM6675672.1 RNA polymerase subunit sigma [Olsenella uli]
MRRDGDLVTRVLAAKRDPRHADDLVRDYLPFIRSETAKFMGRSPQQGRDDELGIAMFAFHEAVLSYDRVRGAFLPFAAMNVRNRLVDFARRERRHADVLSLDEGRPDGDEGDGRPLVETIASERDEIGERQTREASRREIAQFGAELESFGLTFLDVSENCPKQQRTFEACRRVLDCARRNPELLDRLLRTKKLPMAELSRSSGVERKTIERHRRYLVAVLLAFTNGFEIIRGHLRKIVPTGGDGR